MPLVVTPHRVGLPARLGDRPHWGLASQLYSARSAGSWGTGDLVDLEDLGAAVAVDHRAAYVLVNPLHAAEPAAPMEPSPYLPTSRRYVNPLYIRPERIPEYADLAPADRARVDALRGEAVAANTERVDRDGAWAAKRAALRMIFDIERSMGRRCAFGAFEIREGNALTHYATWAAIAEVHGPDWTAWPPELRHPKLPGVEAFRRAHADEVDFQQWLQWVVDEQLAHTQLGLRRAGMGLGVMTDLAVGVNPKGADAWMLQETYAAGVYVGAPPDPYNQNGQDWTQPPWRPDRLAEAAYEPFRRVVQAALRSAGGLRVDHVIGLFRLWWIPRGAGPTEGTYVRYDHEALIGILALEAVRADAVVVGEDLGTVEPWVRDYLAERGILGTSILWFELDHHGGGGPLPADRWRASCLASVTTHDLPPTAGYLAGDHVRLRDSLGLLTRPVEEELRGRRPRARGLAGRAARLGAARRRRPTRPGDRRGAALLPEPDALPVALPGAHRRRGRPPYAEPAGHDRRVPQLAGAPQRPRREADPDRGRHPQRPGPAPVPDHERRPGRRDHRATIRWLRRLRSDGLETPSRLPVRSQGRGQRPPRPRRGQRAGSIRPTTSPSEMRPPPVPGAE